MNQARPSPRALSLRRDDAVVLVPFVCLLVGLALVAYFDLRTNSVISDEYARRWTIQQFLAGKGIRLWGFNPNLAFAAVALVPGAIGLDPRTWRLAGLPFLVAAGVFLYRTSRDLGATRFWAAVAAVAFVSSPLTLSVGTGMMTETAFVGMEAAAVWCSLRWLRSGTHRWWAVVTVAALPLQRPQGIMIAASLAVVLVLAWLRRRPDRKDVVALASVLIASAGTFGLGYYLKRDAIGGFGYPGLHPSGVAFAMYVIAALCPILGFISLPFLAALIRRDRADSLPSWAGKVTVPMAVIGLIFGPVVTIPQLGSIFPGVHLAAAGVGPSNLNSKTDLLPQPVFAAVQLVVVIGFLVVLIWRRRDWSPNRFGRADQFLVLSGALQVLLIYFSGSVFDRYYLPVLLPVIPILAVWASRVGSDTRVSRFFAAGACVLLLAYFGVGQQDFTEWSNARDRAATVAFSRVSSPSDVSAGFEEDAEHIWIPAADHPDAHLPHGVSVHPKLWVVNAPISDPRPGFAYSSIASGKLIIVDATPVP